MGMVDVGSIRVGAEITSIVKGYDGVLYSTISGSVGRLKSITLP